MFKNNTNIVSTNNEESREFRTKIGKTWINTRKSTEPTYVLNSDRRSYSTSKAKYNEDIKTGAL